MADIPLIKTFIIYNFSNKDPFNFECINPEFNIKDDLQIEPLKGRIEANKHQIIKVRLTPKNTLSNYDGELEIKVTWQSSEQKMNRELERDSLFIRLIKRSLIRVRAII